jgi:multidrug efflux pump
MISRFFIDRPIFATVLSIIITLIGGIALAYLPIAQYPRITPPGVTISISYPGASSQVVADTVAAPIEQEVNGVPGMLYMSSQMGNDGSYSLTVTFDINVDLKTALVMVQNRVTLAMPQLPTAVQNQGITIRKRTPDILMIINFFSPDGRYNDIYLSNFATIYVRDELLRVEGVADINYQGLRDYSIRCWLDPQQLASRNMTAIDVAAAIRSQNLDAPSGQIGQPPAAAGQSFQLPIATLGRLHDPEEFGNIIVKATPYRAATRPTSAVVKPSMPKSPVSASDAMPAASTPVGTTTSDSTAGSTTTNAATTGASTGGGATSTGGGTTAGGGATGGGATAVTTGTTADAMDDSTLAGLSIAGGSPDGSDSTGGGGLRRPGRPSAAIVRLRDVARIELGAANYNQACTFDGHPSVGLMVYQLPGTNALDVADAVRKKMDELKTRFPDGVEYEIGYDTTPFIRESIRDVIVTMLEAILLVGAVVLLFLQDWRAMILPMIDVPVSIIGTFAVMMALGYSLNNISLFGLVLAVGIVVDDAIVVLENIERMLAKGLDVRTATIAAMDEVTGPIVAVALVLCAVFIPCAFVSGITGQFFRQFAVTIAVSTVISAINAITMTPSRAVLIFKTEEGKQGHENRHEALPWWFFGIAAGVLSIWFGPWLMHQLRIPWKVAEYSLLTIDRQSAVLFLCGLGIGGTIGWFIIQPVNAGLAWLFRRFNHYFDGIIAGYGWTVGAALRGRLVVLVIYVGLLGLTWWSFQKAPVGFVPQQDQGRLIVSVQLPDSSSLERTKEAVALIDKIAHETAGVAHSVAFCGNSFILQASSPNFASMFLVLDPFDQRQQPELRDAAIMANLKRRWAEEVKVAQVTVYGSSPIPGVGAAGGFKLIVEDRGGLGIRELQTQTQSFVDKLKEIPGLSSVASQFRSRTPQLFLDIDRTKAAALGVELTDLNQTISMLLGSLYVNSFNDFGRHWQVTIQAEGQFRNQVEDINLFQVRNKYGQMVPLGTLVKLREIGGPISMTRYNLYPGAAVNGNVLTGYSTGEAIQAINRIAHYSLPLSMKADWTELMFMQIRAGNTAIYVFLLAIVCVFLSLAALYESWTLPLAVILVVPLCLLCSAAGVIATNRDMNVFVQIGLIVLVGLACKNAILIVEYARHLHQQGQSVFDATVEASRLRLRPILMTSFAFIFGVVPLVIASGAGAEMRRSLGIAVFSGMLGVTVFGIFLTPVFFAVIQGLGETRLFLTQSVQATLSYLMGGMSGAAFGYLLEQVAVLDRFIAGWGGRFGLRVLPWAPAVGACVGVLLVMAVRGIHRKIKPVREEVKKLQGGGMTG